MSYICPNCGNKLNSEERRLFCNNGHSFDRASQGYYNLLLSGGGTHGDNKEMVLARRCFLSCGYYRPLADKLAETVVSFTLPCGKVLDSGCGEGYYTSIVEKALASRDSESEIFAFDISKDAVKVASKVNKNISYSVASAYHQPFSDGSFDTVYNVFSPLAIEEVRRVMKSGGAFIMVVPDEYHLFELKEKIYDTPYKNNLDDTVISGFTLISDTHLKYTMELQSRADIQSLFKMTPYAYRTKKENAERISELDSLKVTADFRIFAYRKDL